MNPNELRSRTISVYKIEEVETLLKLFDGKYKQKAAELIYKHLKNQPAITHIEVNHTVFESTDTKQFNTVFKFLRLGAQYLAEDFLRN